MSEVPNSSDDHDKQDAVTCAFTKGKRHRPAGLRRREAPPDVVQDASYSTAGRSVTIDANEGDGCKASEAVKDYEDEEDVAVALPTKRRAAGASLQTAKAIEALVQQRKQREDAEETKSSTLESLQYAPSKDSAPKNTVDVRATAPDLFHAEDTALAASKAQKKVWMGPSKTPTNVRATCVMDYQPEICKDYAETGYCGFGDNCKFLHDRGDYKSGWQIEKEWEAEQAAKASAALGVRQPGKTKNRFGVEAEDEEAAAAEAAAAEEEIEDDVPFACLKCRKKWSGSMRPVQTRCGHVFCEDCLVQWFRKHGVCPYCKTACGKFYNTPASLIERIQQIRDQVSSSSSIAGDEPQDIRASKHKTQDS